MPTTRSEFKEVARAREREAKALLASNQWSGAYYLSGYAVECGLKSVLVKQFETSALPDKRLVNDAYQHNLQALVGLAGLTQQQSQALNADPLLRVNWSLTKDWTEASRYRMADVDAAFWSLEDDEWVFYVHTTRYSLSRKQAYAMLWTP